MQTLLVCDTPTYLSLSGRLLAQATNWEGFKQSAWATPQETMFPRKPRLRLPLVRGLEEPSSFISWPNLTVYVRSWLLGSWVGRGICTAAVSERTGSRPVCQSAQPCKAQRAHSGGTWAPLSWRSSVTLKLLSVYNLSDVRPP